MGWLERWDRRNQRIVEWHQHVYDEERRGARPSRPSWKAALAIGLGWVLLRLLRPVLYDLVGVGWTIGMMLAITTVLLGLFIRGARRDRRAWEATRETRPSRVRPTGRTGPSRSASPPP